MPFKSEAQRRYLWANEPEIARDWTDTYGSKINAADGGIMRLPFAEAGAVGTLTASEISDLESMAQTYPGTKIGDEAQRKLDINAGKAVEEKEAGFFEGLLGFGKAEGAEMGSTAEDQVRKEFFDYGTQQADIGEYANLKIPGYYTPRNTAADMAAKFYQDLDTDEEALGMNPTFEDIDEETSQYNTVNGLPAIKNKWNMPNVNWGNISTGIGTAFSLANDAMPWGLARRGFDALTSGFNRSTPHQKQQQQQQQEAQQKFINQYNVITNNQGRMVGGPFAGQNMFGTSAFGSKTAAEQAQKNLDRWRDTAPQESIDEWTQITGGGNGGGGGGYSQSSVDAGVQAAEDDR